MKCVLKRFFGLSIFPLSLCFSIQPFAQSAELPAKHDASKGTATASNADAGDISGALDYVRRDMMSIHQSDDGARCVNPKQKFNVHFPKQHQK